MTCPARQRRWAEAKHLLLCAALLCLTLSLFAPQAEAAAESDTESAFGTLPYAVALYGICQDEYLDGEEKAGLSFGPAIGDNYLQSCLAHVSEEDYLRDPEKNLCLHYMSWEEIAAQSLRDPELFRPCLEYGCTHRVELTARRPLFWAGRSGLAGDGASALFDCVNYSYLSWNVGNRFAGGWPASRVRATLNGADEYTDLTLAGENCLTAENCLFSCFPPALQERIVPKAVISDLRYDDMDASECVTTYDRLFLLSACEMHGAISRAKVSEGQHYEALSLHPSKTGSLQREYRFFSESGSAVWAWLRSSSICTDVINYTILGPGHLIGSEFYSHYALAPGFCLP